MGKYDVLFEPMYVGKTKIKNRLVLTAMGGTALINPQGRFIKERHDYYVERAKGGVGLITVGIQDVKVRDEHGKFLYELEDHYSDEIRALTDEVHKYDTKIFCQLGAGLGRCIPLNLSFGIYPKPEVEQFVVSASGDIPNVWVPERKHREMSREEIYATIDAFGKVAKKLMDAGIDGVEVHAVHEGYLLDQFSMECTNHRTDEFGGSLENRLRFATEIRKSIANACGWDFPVMMRYSASSKMRGGFNKAALPGEAYVEFGRTLEESPRVAQILEAAGYDALNSDNGSYDSWFWAHPPMYMPIACNLPEVAYIKNFVKIPVFCAGRMHDPDVDAQAVADHKIDGVGIARVLLCDPHWPNKVKEERVEDIRPCISCHNGCFGRLFSGAGGTSCALNPAVMREKEYEITEAETKKKVVVVGGGIGGMETARLAKMRGHEAILIEKTDKLGGAFIAAAAPEAKDIEKDLIKWYIREVTRLGVDIRFNTVATVELLEELAPDMVIVATGGNPRKLPIPGFDGANVAEAKEILLGKKEAGEKCVVIGGGLTGCEIAHELATQGKKMAIVEMTDALMTDFGLSAANRNMMLELIRYYNIDVHTGTRLEKITETGIVASAAGETVSIDADTVILAVGYTPETTLYEQIKDKFPQVHLIGDAKAVRNLMGSVWDAYKVILEL